MMASTDGSGVTTGQPNLHKQDLSKLDVNALTALSPEVISRQATINIGTIGHVAHGKSTVVKAISGVQTVRFKNELERNITIKLERLEFGSDGKVVLPKPQLINGLRRTLRQSIILNRPSVSTAFSQSNTRPCQLSRCRKRKLSDDSACEKTNFYKHEYVVEKILAHQVKGSSQMFLVKWKGWSQESNTWEPLENLTNCSTLLENFLAESLELPVLAELRTWLNIAEMVEIIILEKYIPKGGFRALPDKVTLQRELLGLASTPREKRTSKMFTIGTRSMYFYMVYLCREKQVNRLKQWEEEMNATSQENAILTVENVVDFEGPPNGFLYVNEYVPSDGIIIPNDPPIGCECAECGPRMKTCCSNQSSFSYRKRGRINVLQGTPIYECNKRCKCDNTCRNRVVQLGRKVPLCIFRTSSGCGWGVKTLRKIHPGEFVCEYVGEVISFEEAERRGRGYDAQGRTYLFDLDFNSNDFPYTVDAATYGNVSHFINHSCSPNLAVWAVWVNCLDPNIPKLALFATRKIERGEQITFDYMCSTVSNSADTNVEEIPPSLNSPPRSRLTLPNGDGTLFQNCKCGADTCRRYLF